MPKTLERDLLDTYEKAASGLLLRESQIPLPGGCRIDGLLVPDAAPGDTLEQCAEAGHDARVIEVKSGLSEEVIGQVLVGAELIRRTYPGLGELTLQVVCEVASRDMLEFAASRGVEVWSPNNSHLRTQPGEVMRSRTPLLWRPSWLDMLEPLRRAQPTLHFTQVPLGPEQDGAPATFVNLMRLPAGPDLLAKFENASRLQQWVGGAPVELIEVRNRARRGAVGRLLGHEFLLRKYYGIEVSARRVVVAEADPVLASAFATFGVMLGTPEEHARRSLDLRRHRPAGFPEHDDAPAPSGADAS